MLGPAKIAALLHRKLEPREGREEPQGFVGWEAVEKFVGGEHGCLSREWNLPGWTETSVSASFSQHH
jgi:hypothetical protein